MRLACIDIGSNTTRLLVADCERGALQWIHQERSFTALGHELAQRGLIGAKKIAEVASVVRDQRDSARLHHAVQVHAVATEAVRSAANGDELTAAVHAATGLEVDVLTPREEARLAFVGVAGTIEQAPPGELGVVDVGGGSTELVVGSPPDTVRWWASAAIGSGELTEPRLTSDPPTDGELTSARVKIAAALSGLDVPRPAVAIAVGGSATSLSRLAGQVLDASSVARALSMLVAAPSIEVSHRFMIDPQRARLLPAGLLILEGVAEAFRAPLIVGQGGIREGVLLEASKT